MKTDYNITQTLQRKMTALLGLICILNLAPVFSYPKGAPAQACVNIYPAGHINVTRDLNHTGEAWLNLDSFKGGSYIPGNKYTCKPRVFTTGTITSIRMHDVDARMHYIDDAICVQY